MYREIVFVVSILLAGCTSMSATSPRNPSELQVPTAAIVTTDSAGKASEAAKSGVLRVICRPTSFGGTGFLHKSGNVLTAAHVVADCRPQDLILLTSNGQQFAVSNVVADDDKDLALLRSVAKLPGVSLEISTNSTPVIGAQVSTWGYPGGYNGLYPLLSVGYFSGTQEFVASRHAVTRWVINAAFNGGNSGGPVLSVEDGHVIGVVSSKLAPLPESIAQILKVLSAQRAILQYERVNADGTKTSLSEGQVVAEVLNYLRSQVQLVIGYSVTTQDLKEFLTVNGIDP